MKPGEYRDASGALYRWAKVESGLYRHELCADERGWFERYIITEDWPAAKAALDALIEEEAGEWAEIDENARVRRDGSSPQWRSGGGLNNWNEHAYPSEKRWPKAYDAGLRVGHEDAKELAEALKEALPVSWNASDPDLVIVLAKKVLA